MKNLLIIATLSLGTLAMVQPCFAQKTPAAQPFLSSYDDLHEAQQKEIMRTWNVVGTPTPFLSSYDEQLEAQQEKIVRTWNAVEVVRATTAPEASNGKGVSKDEGTKSVLQNYHDLNTEQIKMNISIKKTIEF